jgi:replication factor C subunit 1
MNYKISSGTAELRMSYLPVLRERFLTLLKSDAGVEQAIELMDQYGLDRDDVFEKLDEFQMEKGDNFAKIDSKKKAAFTREYNKGVHKSQALVAEQGAAKKPKRQPSGGTELGDPDAIDDDKAKEEEDEIDDEEDAEKIAAMFKKNGRKSATGAKSKGKASTTAKSRKGKK